MAKQTFGTLLEQFRQSRGLIVDELARRGIEIPFPQRDLHVRSDDTKSRPPAADLSDEAPST